MNTKTLKCMTAAVSLLTGIGTAFSEYAAGDGPTARGIGSNDPNKDKIGATDVYLLACSPGPVRPERKSTKVTMTEYSSAYRLLTPMGVPSPKAV